MSVRRALEERLVSNVPVPRPYGEQKPKKDVNAVAKAKEKRTELGGRSTSTRADNEDNQTIVEDLQNQLAAARLEMQTQKDTIIRLSNKKPDTEMKDRLTKLVDKYEQAKTKHKSELDNAMTDNRSLRSVIDTLQASSTEMQQTITALRSDKAALTQKLRNIETAPAVPVRSGESEAKHRDERLAWRKEKAELESQLRKATRGAGDVDEMRKERETLEAENDRLEETIANMTYLYRLHCRSSVPASALAEAKDELALAMAELRALKSTAAQLRQRAQAAQSDVTDMAQLLEITRLQLGEVLRVNEDLMADRRADRQIINLAPCHSIDTHIPPLEPHDHLLLIDAIRSHLDLSQTSSATLVSTLLSTASDLRTEAETLRDSTLEAQTSLLSAKTRTLELETKLSEAEAVHSSCAQQILDWRGEASRASAMESRLRSELSDTKRSLADAEGREKEAKERLKRANEQNGRGGAAMQAMEDELAELRAALGAQRELENKLEGTEQDRQLLQLQCHDLADELDRVGQMQAELMGHSNEGQRISYMEGMRREMAVVKHELTTTRHNLNLANTRITALSDEVASYKSLDSAALAAAPGRIRVSRSVRKEPENGEVMGASMARRGLSGSTGSAWR